MDIKVLEEYKKRLVNFSGRNQTLKRNKLYAKRAFDLKRVEKFEENIIERILNQILYDTDKDIIIIDKNKKILLEKNEIEKIEKNYLTLIKNSKKIKSLYSEKEIDKILKNKDRESILKIQKNLQEEKKENIKFDLENIFKNLDILKNEIDTVEKETGLYQLYIGYPFIEGRLEDGTDVRAPLFLFPCKLEKMGGKFIYKNLNENSIYINRSFLLAYSNATRKDFRNLKDEYDTVEEIFSLDNSIKTQKDYLKKCFEFLLKNQINVDSYFKEEVESYIDYKKESYNKFSRGELYLKNYFIIGQYTIGDNGIYKDYETLCDKKNLSHEIVDNLLKYDKNAVYDEKELNTINKENIKIDEKNSFFITELDYSQEKAIKMAEELKSLVIYGPPGTGKSQVIANIISDNLAKDKKILVVSEKRTALDVVYKRLEKCNLNKRIGFVHDIKSDKKAILEKVVAVLDSIEKQSVNENIYNGIENISNEIENRIKKLDNLKNVLFEKQPCGINLYELYSNSKLKDMTIPEILNNFEEYNIFNYEELKEIIQKLEKLKNGLIYDTLPVISNRKSFAEKSDLENIKLVSKLKRIDSFYEESRINKVIQNLKTESKNIYNILIEKNKKEKEEFEKFCKEQKNSLFLLLNQEIQAEQNKYKEDISNSKEKILNKIKTRQSEIEKNVSEAEKIIEMQKSKLEEEISINKTELLYKTEIEKNEIKEKISVNKEKIVFDLNILQNKMQELKEELKDVNIFDCKVYENIEELNKKRKEYISLSFISFLRKSKLKKELMLLDYGNTIEEKLSQIEEIKKLKNNNEEILNNLIFVFKCKNFKELKNKNDYEISIIEKLKNKLEKFEDLNYNLGFTEEINETIFKINELQKKYKLLCKFFEMIKNNNFENEIIEFKRGENGFIFSNQINEISINLEKLYNTYNSLNTSFEILKKDTDIKEFNDKNNNFENAETNLEFLEKVKKNSASLKKLEKYYNSLCDLLKINYEDFNDEILENNKKEKIKFLKEIQEKILNLGELEEDYKLLCKPFEIIKQETEKIKNEKICEVISDIQKLEKSIIEYNKKDIDYTSEIKKDFKQIKIDNINNLIYFKNILQRYDFKEKSEELENIIKELKNIFIEVQDITKEFEIQEENIFARFFNGQVSSFSETIKILDNNFEQIKDYDIKKSKLSKEELIIFELFKKSKHYDDFLKSLKNTYCLKWIEYAEKRNNEILNDIQYFKNIKNKSFDLIQEKKKLIPEYITEKWNRKIRRNFIYNRGHKEITYSDLRHESKKKRKVLSLRNYISRFKDNGLFDILPCWLLTPETVSDILPLSENIFDIIIFDEASQIFIEKSIPAIYRAKSIVIAGDDKQLQPNSVAKKKLDKFDDIEGDFDDIEDEEFEENDTTALDEVSLLDVAQKMYKGALLSYHYRSNYEELINFSNYAFYKGRLMVAPNKEDKNYIPIERIKVNGIWDKRKNLQEAEETYSLVKKILKERKENESIGIVTFNEAQKELIRTYLEDQCEKDPEFSVLYLREKIRHDDTEDKSIFIKNIENVQGDERDIIIFSIGYAKDIETGRIASRFGTLSQAGGENRLNVAISRAKKKIYVITSIEPEELMVDTSKNEGPKLFKKYLEYVKAVSEGRKQEVKEILNSFFKKCNAQGENEIHFDSDFEKEVYTALENCNYEVHTQIGVSGYRIDLGIYSKEKSEYILGIECDGATYYSSPSARERDVYRQKFLESKGWTIHRIWSKDWWRNPENEIRKIKNLLQNLG